MDGQDSSLAQRRLSAVQLEQMRIAAVEMESIANQCNRVLDRLCAQPNGHGRPICTGWNQTIAYCGAKVLSVAMAVQIHLNQRATDSQFCASLAHSDLSTEPLLLD